MVNCSPMNVYREDGLFLKEVFAGGMLPKLKHLETDAATDDGIAEMKSCPNLSKITFSYPSVDITNDGIQRLVDGGGGKELMSISSGTLTKHLSKTLTIKYVAVTLPKLINIPHYKLHEYLTHMAQGSKKKSAFEYLLAKHAAEDSKPYAVIPPERMKYSQMEDALKRRGWKKSGGRKTADELRVLLINEGQFKWTHEREVDIQNGLKLKDLQKELEWLSGKASSVNGKVQKLSSMGSASKLYPLLDSYDIKSALRNTNVNIPKGSSQRRDVIALLLHNSGYQGGGDANSQLVHYRKVAATEYEKVATKQAEIQALCTNMGQKKRNADLIDVSGESAAKRAKP